MELEQETLPLRGPLRRVTWLGPNFASRAVASDSLRPFSTSVSKQAHGFAGVQTMPGDVSRGRSCRWLSNDQHRALALRHNALRDRAEDGLGQSRAAVRTDADQVSAETLGFLPDNFGNIACLDHGDLSLDSARGGVRRNLRTQTLLGLGNDLDRPCLQQARRLENVEQPHDATGRYRAVCIRNRTAAVLGEVARGKHPADGALWRSIVSTRAAGMQATLIGALRNKPREMEGCATRPKPCRWWVPATMRSDLLLARHLDQSQVGATDAWFDADAGDALPQQGTRPFR